MQPTQRAGNPAVAGGIVILICGLLILAATFTHHWFWNGEGDSGAGVGMTGMQMCIRGKCDSISWGHQLMRGTPKDIRIFGYLGLAAGLASGLLSIVFGAMALARKTKSIPTVLGIIAYSITPLVWAVFMVRILGEMKGHDKMGPGYSAMLGFVGVIGAFVALLALLGPIRKRERGGGAMPMQQAPMMQACPRCAGPLTFVAQYQRWFCQRCQQYV